MGFTNSDRVRVRVRVLDSEGLWYISFFPEHPLDGASAGQVLNIAGPRDSLCLAVGEEMEVELLHGEVLVSGVRDATMPLRGEPVRSWFDEGASARFVIGIQGRTKLELIAEPS